MQVGTGCPSTCDPIDLRGWTVDRGRRSRLRASLESHGQQLDDAESARTRNGTGKGLVLDEVALVEDMIAHDSEPRGNALDGTALPALVAGIGCARGSCDLQGRRDVASGRAVDEGVERIDEVLRRLGPGLCARLDDVQREGGDEVRLVRGVGDPDVRDLERLEQAREIELVLRKEPVELRRRKGVQRGAHRGASVELETKSGFVYVSTRL